jgi:hypothetical protein
MQPAHFIPPLGHNIQILTNNPFANIIIMIMTKSALKLILCWALVTVGSAQDSQIANVNFYCTTPDDANHNHCSQPIVEGSLTPDQKMMDIFNRCVFRATGANLDFANPFPDRRALRAARNDEAGERGLGPCDGCVCNEACCMMGYCGSSCTCTCACERRLLEDENEIISILQGRRFLPDVTEIVEESCTSEVRLLAILLQEEDNFCLGSDPSQIVCSPTVITADDP